MRPNCRVSMGMVLCMLSVGSAARADVIFVSQMRTLDAHATVTRGPDTIVDDGADAAGDFGMFDSQVSANALLPFTFAHGDADQVSVMTSELIHAQGSAGAGVLAGADTDGDADGASKFDVTFQVDTPVAYTLDMEVSVYESSPLFTLSSAVAGIQGPGGVVANIFVLVQAGTESLHQEGVLPPGEYRVTGMAVADFGMLQSVGGTRASYVLNLVIPEPGTAMLLAFGALLAGRRRRRCTDILRS